MNLKPLMLRWPNLSILVSAALVATTAALCSSNLASKAAPAWLSPVVVAASVITCVGVLLWRSPVVAIAALLLVVGARSAQAAAALEVASPRRVRGEARLVSDPERRSYDTNVIVSIDGRRYVASVPQRLEDKVAGLLSGEHVFVSGRVADLDGAPSGWVLAMHLAGRLAVDEVRPGAAAPPWYALANGIRRTIARGSTSMGSETRSLYLGLVMGDDRGQSDLTQFRFRASGLSHLLAVSGQNVAFLLAVAEPVTRRFGTRGGVVFGCLLLVVFALVTRAEPSVLRAAVMAAMALVAVAAERTASGLRILALSVMALTAVDPLMVRSLGFQLSVAATAGLLVLSRPIEQRLWGPRWLRLPLAVTIAAQLSTAPLLASVSGGLPAVATMANLLAVPVAGIVMMFGVTAGLVAGLLKASVARVMLWPVTLAVRWIGWVADFCSRLPTATLGAGRTCMVVVGLLALLTRVEITGLAPRGPRGGVVRMLGAVLVLLACWPSGTSPGRRSVSEGAALFKGRCGEQVVVIDGAIRVDDVLSGLWVLGIRNLDAVVTDGGVRSGRIAQDLREQLGPLRVLVPSDSAVSVGSLQFNVRTRRASSHSSKQIDVRTVDSGAACNF